MDRKEKHFPDLVVVAGDSAKVSSPERGLQRRILAYNDKVLVVEHRMEKGWSGTIHSHPQEQAVYVVRGRLAVTCEGQTFEVQDGGTFVVRGGVEHGASALEDSVVVDVFTPLRDDYIG